MSNYNKIEEMAPSDNQKREAEKQLKQLAKTAKLHDVVSPLKLAWRTRE